MPTDANDETPGSGLNSAIALWEREIERLKLQLEVIKASDDPQRRTMIIDYVSRIDERQDALDKLRVAAPPSEPPSPG